MEKPIITVPDGQASHDVASLGKEKRDYNDVLKNFLAAEDSGELSSLVHDIDFLVRNWDDDNDSAVRMLKEEYPGWEKKDFIRLLKAVGIRVDDPSEKPIAIESLSVEEIHASNLRRLKERRLAAMQELELFKKNGPKIFFDWDIDHIEHVSFDRLENFYRDKIDRCQQKIAGFQKEIEREQEEIRSARGLFKGGKIKKAHSRIDYFTRQIQHEDGWIKTYEGRIEQAKVEQDKQGNPLAEKTEEKLKSIDREIEAIEKQMNS